MKVAQQCRHLPEQVLQAREGNFAHFAVVERDGVAMVQVAADGIHAKQFACHLKARDLLFAPGIDLVSLEVAKPNRVQVAKRFTHLVQAIVFGNPTPQADNLVQARHVGFIEPHRQAQLVHAARAAAGLEGTDIDFGDDLHGLFHPP